MNGPVAEKPAGDGGVGADVVAPPQPPTVVPSVGDDAPKLAAPLPRVAALHSKGGAALRAKSYWLALCAGSMLVATLVSSLAQDALRYDYNMRVPRSLAAAVPAVTAIAGATRLGGGRRLAAPLQAHLLCGVCMFVSFLFIGESAALLPTPVFQALRAARLVPTMLVGFLLLRKRYQPADWAAGLAVAVGIGVLQAGNSHGGVPEVAADAASDDPVDTGGPLAASHLDHGGGSGGGGGMSLLYWVLRWAGAGNSAPVVGTAAAVIALAADGLYGNLQELMVAQYGASVGELSTLPHVLAAVILAGTSMRAAGGVTSATTAAVVEGGSWLPTPGVGLLLALHTAGNVVAALSAMALLARFGATPTQFTAAVCKASTVALAVAFRPQHCTAHMVAGFVIVFAASLGLALQHVWARRRAASDGGGGGGGGDGGGGVDDDGDGDGDGDGSSCGESPQSSPAVTPSPPADPLTLPPSLPPTLPPTLPSPPHGLPPLAPPPRAAAAAVGRGTAARGGGGPRPELVVAGLRRPSVPVLDSVSPLALALAGGGTSVFRQWATADRRLRRAASMGGFDVVAVTTTVGLRPSRSVASMEELAAPVVAEPVTTAGGGGLDTAAASGVSLRPDPSAGVPVRRSVASGL